MAEEEQGPRSVADAVHDELVDRLTTGAVPPGSRLSINAIARQLDVSPSPVREALARLVLSGLAERVRPRGFAAAPLLDRVGMQRLAEARLLIEVDLTELAVRRAPADLADRLEASLDGQRRSTGPGADRRRGEEFHLLLARAADNRFLFDAYLGLGGHVERFRVQAATGSFDRAAALAEHERILVAVRSGDPCASAEAMRSHLERANARTQIALGPGPAS